MNAKRLRKDREGQAWSRANSCEKAIGSVVAALIHDPDDREDLALLALIHLGVELCGHEPGADVETCARRIARDVCNRHLRRVAQHPQVALEGDGGVRDSGDAGVLCSWEDILRGERVRVALASLPPRTRTAFELHWGEGLTVKETAARLGMKPQALRMLLERWMKAVRSKLGEDMG